MKQRIRLFAVGASFVLLCGSGVAGPAQDGPASAGESTAGGARQAPTEAGPEGPIAAPIDDPVIGALREVPPLEPPVPVEEAQGLDEIYEAALQNDRTLSAARASFRAGLEERVLGRSELLPRLEASFDYTDSDASARGQFAAGGVLFPSDTDRETESTIWRVSLSQPLFNVPAWFRFQRGQELSKQAEADFSVAQQDLMVRTTEAYFEVLRAVANLQASQAQERALEGQLEQVRQRYDVGMVAIIDVHEAEAAHDLAVAQRIADEGAVDIARELLTEITGRRHPAVWRLRDDFEATRPEPPDSDAWVAFAHEHNFDIKAAEYARNSAQMTARAAASEHLPRVNLSVQHSEQSTDVFQKNLIEETETDFEDDRRQTSIVISATLPLYAGGMVSAGRRQASARFESQREQYEATKRNVTQRTRASYIQVTNATVRMRANRRSIVSARSALDAAQTGYEVGTRNIVDVLDAQRSFFSAVRDYHNTNFDYVQGLFRLKRVAGTLTPQDIFELSEWLEPPGGTNG